MRDQKGITLIALIITIIVMLILVTVTVTVALQSGLFESAGDAVQRTDEQLQAENDLASGQVNVNGTEADIDDIVNQYTNNT